MTGQRPEHSGLTLLRAVSQWVVGVVLAALLTLFFLTVSAVQLSSDGVGERLLRRSVAVTTNIDAILPDLQAGLHEAARSSDEDTVRLPDFPIPVEFPREEALSLEGAALRERVLQEASARLYHDGMSAWAEGDPGGRQDVEPISIAGALERGLGLITDSNHDWLVVAAVVLGLLSAATAALLVASVKSWARLIALSAATTAAALPPLASAVGLRFAFRTAQEEADPFVYGLLELGVEAMWVPIQNFLALTVLGFTVLFLTLAFIWASGRLAARSAQAPPA